MFEGLVHYITNPGVWISFLTLCLLEIVLGIDNVIFISIVANRLKGPERARARALGLLLALFMRVGFLASIVWIVGLTHPIVSLGNYEFSWRDLILGSGGLFLLYKATVEIVGEMRGQESAGQVVGAAGFSLVVVQIVLLDLVFSIDSIVTAVGLSRQLPVMIAAIMVAIFVMLVAAGPVGEFIHRHPTVKMLALAFLLLIGCALVADAAHIHIRRIYLYAAIAFSFIVEVLTLVLPHVRRNFSFVVFGLCLLVLGVADLGLRIGNIEIPWTYLYVPAAFGLFVQLLNRIAESRGQAVADALNQRERSAKPLHSHRPPQSNESRSHDRGA